MGSILADSIISEQLSDRHMPATVDQTYSFGNLEKNGNFRFISLFLNVEWPR